MLAAVHSLLVYQSLHGMYSDACHWSVADLSLAVSQLQAVGCDLQSLSDVTHILTNVYAARCNSKCDAEKIRTFISHLVRTWAAGRDVNVSSLHYHLTPNALLFSKTVNKSSAQLLIYTYF